MDLTVKKVCSSDFCKLIFDGTHDSPKYVDSGLPLVTSKCIIDSHLDISTAPTISKEDYDVINRRSKVEKGDILISMIGINAGIVGRITQTPSFAIKNVGVFRCKNDIDSKFLYYYLQSDSMKNYLHSAMAGSAQPYICLEQLRNLDFFIPVSDYTKQHIVNIVRYSNAS